MAVIGVDLGGTKIAAAIFDHFGNIKAKEVRLLNGAEGDKVGKLVTQTILSLMEGNPRQHIKAIGVCVPGIVYSKKHTVWAPNIPGWDNYHLKRRIEAAIQNPKIKISIESDRTCYVLGEVWKGGAKGCQNAIYLAVGTGIGGGILIDGRVLHGHSDIVGATGWMALQNPYHEDFIPCGCFEHYASGNGIALQAQKALRCEKNYTGPLSAKPIEEITSPDVFAAESISRQHALSKIRSITCGFLVLAYSSADNPLTLGGDGRNNQIFFLGKPFSFHVKRKGFPQPPS